MSSEETKFAKLIDLAKETSSEKRRDLLREVTDVFFAETNPRSDTECQMFDEIVVAVANDMTKQVREELAYRVSQSNSPLRKTAKRLATDTITVARPILTKSTCLTDEDLVNIVNSKPQSHLLAVSKRRNIGEVVSAALVNKGEDEVVVSLLENETAQINHDTFVKVAERAQTSKALQGPLVQRKAVPIDVLNDVYAVVEPMLRRKIMARFDQVSEADLQNALKNSRARLNASYADLPEDLEDAKQWLRNQVEGKRLAPPILIQLLRDGRKTHFKCALSFMSDMPFAVVNRIIAQKDIDALSILCRSMDMEKPLFTSIAVVVIGGENSVSQAQNFAKYYDDVPPTAAQRAVRFWKVRSATSQDKSRAA